MKMNRRDAETQSRETFSLCASAPLRLKDSFPAAARRNHARKISALLEERSLLCRLLHSVGIDPATILQNVGRKVGRVVAVCKDPRAPSPAPHLN